MTTYANPFHPAPGASPPFLGGREAELAAIRDAVSRLEARSAPVPMAFLGLRGLGKTVLLNEVRRRTPDALHLAVEVETGVPLHALIRDAIESLQRRLEKPSQRLLKGIRTALQLLPSPEYDLPHGGGAVRLASVSADEQHDPVNRSLGSAIEHLREGAMAVHRPLVITVDEIQDVDVPGFRTLAARVHQAASTDFPILFACAGLPESRKTLTALRTYARTRWERFDLAFLTRAETAEAIRVPLQATRVTIDDAALDLLTAECAGYPYFIQKYASAAWNERSGSTITLEDARAAVALTRPQIDKLFYADEFASLTERERKFCKALADLGEGPQALGDVAHAFNVPSASISSLRGNLLKKGVIYSPAPGKVEFRMPLADRYIREHSNEFAFRPKGPRLAL